MGKYNPFLETTEPDEDVNPFLNPESLERVIHKAETPEPEPPYRGVLRLPRKNK